MPAQNHTLSEITYPTIGRGEVPAGSFIPLRPLAESGFESMPDSWLVCTPTRDADLGRDVLTVTFAYSYEADARGTAAHLHERGYDITLVKPAEQNCLACVEGIGRHAIDCVR